MINPNETKSVFWLIIIIVACILAFAGYSYYKNHKQVNNAPATEPEPAPVETGEVVE